MNIAKLTKNIPNSLKNYGASLNIIKQAGDSAITSTQGLFLATNGLNDAQTKAFLIKNQLRMGTKALTEVQLVQLLTEKGMTAEKAKETAAEVTNTVAKGANAGASGTQTVANLGLLGSIKAVTTGLLASTAAWLASPMGMVTVTAAAIYGIVKAVDYFNVSLKEQKQELSEIRQKFNELKSSLSSAESELETTTARIKELLDLQANNKITFVEQDELDKLQTANLELEKQIELLKIQKENAQKGERESATKVFNKDLEKADLGLVYENGKIVGYSFWHGVEDVLSTVTLGLFGSPRWADALAGTTRDGISGSLATENDYLEQQVQRYEELGSQINETNLRLIELKTRQESKTITKDEKKELKQLEKDVKEYEDIQTYLLGKQNEFKETIGDLKLIDNPSTDAEKAFNEWYKLFDDLSDTIIAMSSPEKYREWKLDEILSSDKFSDTVNKLKELGNDWQLTPSVIESYSEFNAAIEEIGVTSKDVADKLNGIAIPPEFIEFDGGKLIQNVRFIQSKLDSGKLTYSEYATELEKLSEKLKDPNAIETFIELFGRITPAVSSSTNTIVSEFERISDAYDKLTSAMKKAESGEAFSMKEIMELVKGGYIKLSDVNFVDMTIPVKAFKDGLDEMDNDWRIFVGKEKDKLEKGLSEAEVKLDVAIKEDNQTEIERLKTEIQSIKDEIAGVNNTPLEIKSVSNLDLFNKQLQDSLTTLRSYKSILDELDSKGLSTSSVDKIISSYPELLAYLDDEVTLRGKLKEKIEEQEKAVIISQNNILLAYYQTATTEEQIYLHTKAMKLYADTEFYRNCIKNNAQLIDLYKTNYNIDLTNFKSLAEAKAYVDEVLIKNLAGAWAKYYSVQTNAETGMYEAILTDAGKKSIITHDIMEKMYIEANNKAKDMNNLIAGLNAVATGTINGLDNFSGSSDSGSTQDYLAKINRLYEAEERLARVQKERGLLQNKLSMSNTLAEQKELLAQDLKLMQEEQKALHALNEDRRGLIAENLDELRSKGFKIEYDAAHNDIFIKNMAHLNELTGDTTQKYETLIKDTLELVNANEDASESYRELNVQFKKAAQEYAIYDTKVREKAVTMLENQAKQLFDNMDMSGWTRNVQMQANEIQAIMDILMRQIQASVDEVEINDLWGQWYSWYDKLLAKNEEIYRELINQHDRYISARSKLNNWGNDNELAALKRKEQTIEQSYRNGLISYRKYNEDMLAIVEARYDAQFRKQNAMVDGVLRLLNKEKEALEELILIGYSM